MADPLFTIENNIVKGRVVQHEPRYISLGKQLFDSLKNNPNFVGQVDGITGTEDTFANMLDRAIKCALWMQKQGVKKGDIIAISSYHHFDSPIPCIAAMFLAAIFSPWEHELDTQLARHLIKLTEPKVIFASKEAAVPLSEAATIEASPTKIVVYGDSTIGTPFSEILKGHSESDVTNFQYTEIDDFQQTATICFTSGTTGVPKGAQTSHRTWLSFLDLQAIWQIDSPILLWFAPLSWATSIILSYKCILSPRRKIISPPFDEKTACEIIEKFKVRFLFLGPSVSNRLIRYPHLQEYDLSSVEIVVITGGSVNGESQDLWRKRFPHLVLLPAYGMTETGMIACHLPTSTSGSTGFLDRNVEVKIVDVETKKTLDPSQTGEICVRSCFLMSGYYRNPEATKETIDEEGWLYTGDLGYFNGRGELFIVDRQKELIKYRGHHVVPNELETLLYTHPAVLEVAVVGMPHVTDSEHPTAFVSKVPNAEVSAEELVDLVAQNLRDRYKLRGGVKFLPSLPHTSNGKIMRKELKAMAQRLAGR